MQPIKKVLITKEGRRFFIKNLEVDAHNQFGMIKKEELSKQDGSKIESNMGNSFYLASPTFRDIYSKIQRGAQIIPLKDIGAIITELGIGKESKVLDCGAGSGALSCLLAHIAKEVISYEIREDFQKIVRENIDSLGLTNITLKTKDIYQGIDETQLDAITLDVPEPWLVLPHAAVALKAGGFLASYSPSITQTTELVNAILEGENFCHIKTFEIIEREWEILGRKVRPVTAAVGHSGFITIARKLQ